MMFMGVNMIPVVIAGIVNMAIGFAWYSPMLFGVPWMKEMGLTQEKLKDKQKEMGMLYFVSFLAAVLMAFVLSMLKNLIGFSEMSQILMLGFWVWLGFVATVQLTDVIFGGRSTKLYFINTGYQLASMLGMALVLGYWM